MLFTAATAWTLQRIHLGDMQGIAPTRNLGSGYVAYESNQNRIFDAGDARLNVEELIAARKRTPG